ncbi:transposase [Lacrimispora sp.]|uniref:transposase n=1 Tax=Lacrimispora sp. TaxID=2719234 RepID=UPI0028AB48D9|nr:transposase [Lacrimispora sp.]
MKDLLEISYGLDVHKDKIVACILSGPIGKPTSSEIREFTTLIPDMAALRDWIVSCGCHHVAMESTGIYWQPIYEILEDAFSGGIRKIPSKFRLSFINFYLRYIWYFWQKHHPSSNPAWLY